MELKQLSRFLAVVDEGTLAEAARNLGLTQQAISASIASLEKELGVRLFDRTPGGVTRTTAYADALIPHARSQIAGDIRARNTLHALSNADTGVVTIGVGETFAGDLIAEALTSVHHSHPQLRVNVIEGYSELLLERFYKGEFDFVAIGVSGFSLREGYHAESIYAANDVVTCRPNHPLLSKPNLKLKDLQGYGWLVPYSRPSDTNIICEAFVAEGLEPPTQFIGSDAYRIGMQVMIRNDLLTMTSPALVANRFAEQAYGIKILKIDHPTVRRYASLILNSKRPLTPAAAVMLENIRTAVKDVKTTEMNSPH